MKNRTLEKICAVISVIISSLLLGFVYIVSQFGGVYFYGLETLLLIPIIAVSIIHFVFSLKEKNVPMTVFSFVLLNLYFYYGFNFVFYIRDLLSGEINWYDDLFLCYVVYIVNIVLATIAFVAMVITLIKSVLILIKKKEYQQQIDDSATKLKELKQLLDNDLISSSEYEEKRQKYVDQL